MFDKIITLTTLSMCIALPVVAQGSPWIPAPGATSATFSYVHQEADEFYLGSEKNDLPDDLKQSTKWISLKHGLTDNIALDAQIGYAISKFSPADDSEGFVDSKFGITYRFIDEAVADTNVPSVAVRAGIILEGNYDTGRLNAVGDGADGAEVALALGKVFQHGFALNSDLGYRYRSSNTPNELFLNLGAHYSITAPLTASLTYQMIDSNGDLDIGANGFSPPLFTAVEEDNQSLSASLAYQVNDTSSIGLTYGSVVDGRNTSASDFYALSITTGF